MLLINFVAMGTKYSNKVAESTDFILIHNINH